MANEYPSVDDFVAAYLANCDPPSQQGPAPTANGLPFAGANSLQPTYQQIVSTEGPHQFPSEAQGQGVQGKWQGQGTGDVYMQPYDQTAHQVPLGQYGQQADWQLQQQQLEALHHQQQEAQQQQQQQQMLAMQTAAELQAAAAVGLSAAPTAMLHPASNGSTSKSVQQQEASTSATGKRTSRSKSSTRGRKPKQEQDTYEPQPMLQAELDNSFVGHNLGHTMSAPPQASDPATAAAMAAQLGMTNSFPAFGQAGPIFAPPGNLANVLMMQQQAQAARQQQAAGAQAMQTQSSLFQEDNEPDMSHLTVMQRYHARRKLAVQRMEREVEEKIAQLAVLEQENRQLKWQAHILENMLLDMDKQVELMSAEELPDASQWLTLLGMGTNVAAGSNGVIARTLHKMLEGAAATDITGWTAEHCRRKWLAMLEQLRPLVEQAEAAQAAYRSAQGSSGDQQDTASQQPQRRPRRAAAAAAVAVIKQEAADVLGVAPLPVPPAAANIPDVPVPQHHAGQGSHHGSSSRSPASSPPDQPAATGGAGEVSSGGASAAAAQQMEGVQQPLRSSGSLSGAAPAASDHSVGSFTGSEVSHGPDVEGVPAAVLSKIEDIVMKNFYWLLAIMTRNPVLTYEFISADLIEGRTPLPPQQHEMWGAAIERMQLTREQLQECCTCLQVSRRCMAKVIEERAEVTAALPGVAGTIGTGLQTQAWMPHDLANQNQADVTVERMRANVRKESVVRNLVGFYCINVISLYQLARMSLACSPWFCMAWRIAGAAEEKLNRDLAGETAMQQQATGHTTRSSARLAAQR